MGHYIEVEKGIKLFVEDIGKGKPVVFLHGWPANHKMFEYQMTELPNEGYRFIGIDMRGYGKSDRPWNGYDYDRMADDVRAVIDMLELDNVSLLGFSMGGSIAIRYMTKHSGHHVSKLILSGAAAPIFTQQDDYPYGMKQEEVTDLIQATFDDRPKMLEDFGSMFFAKEKSEPFTTWFFNLGLDASPHGTIKSAEALRDEDLRSELANVKVPTAIFHGKQDQICPFEFAEEMHRGIENSTIIAFEDSGHGTIHDEREKFNTELINFLND